MTKVCRTCGHWVNFIHGHWLDEHDDDACYDDDLTLIGRHEPADVTDEELEHILDELEKSFEEAAEGIRRHQNRDFKYPAGVDGERMRELWRAKLKESLREALERRRGAGGACNFDEAREGQ